MSLPEELRVPCPGCGAETMPQCVCHKVDFIERSSETFPGRLMLAFRESDADEQVRIVRVLQRRAYDRGYQDARQGRAHHAGC